MRNCVFGGGKEVVLSVCVYMQVFALEAQEQG